MLSNVCKGKRLKGKAIFGILVGTILGLVLGFLFAPKPGKQTRKEILGKVTDDLSIKTAEIKVKVMEKAENAQEEFNDIIEKVEKVQDEILEITEELKDKLKEKVQSRKEKKTVNIHIDEQVEEEVEAKEVVEEEVVVEKVEEIEKVAEAETVEVVENINVEDANTDIQVEGITVNETTETLEETIITKPKRTRKKKTEAAKVVIEESENSNEGINQEV